MDDIFNDSLGAKKWYDEYEKATEPSKHGKSEMDVINLKAEAKKCLDSESTAYHLKQSRSNDSQYSWLKTALSKGTISDKVAAGIVLVQNSPKHNLNHLTTLISQVKIAKHNQCSMIVGALKDLFLNDLLHPHYKLLKFEEQNLDKLESIDKAYQEGMMNLKKKNTLSRNKVLGIWYFEDQLKESYERFITSLSVIANDTVDSNREKTIIIMNDLLIGNPEQEQKLLDLIINKIGDPSSKVASKAIFALTKLLYEHSNMKLIVLHEVEKLLFRNNVSPRTQYFAICLLTQFILEKDDNEVATTLINIYFAFFNACLKKGEPDTRMMAAILTGVNRAYPFANINSTKLNEHIESVYKVVHLGSFNVSLNALSLLFQVVTKNNNHLDRYYSTFYRKLHDFQIGVSNRRAVFLNLFFKILCNDHSIARIHAFIKRILQMATYFPANMICAILYVISQVLHIKNCSKTFLSKIKKNDKNVTEINISDTLDETVEKQKVEKKEQENSIILSNVITKISENTVKTEKVDIKTELRTTVYDPFIRNPLHCGANLSFCCELAVFTHHYHPSVSLFAKTIIQGKRIEYTGDPLEDLALIRFLDRYVFKNPKKLESKKVIKKNDPMAQRSGYTPLGVRALAVDSQAYLSKSEDMIPVDELFLYQYMHSQRKIKGVKKEQLEDDDNESVNSEEFNEMLDKLSKDKQLRDLDIAGDFAPPKKSKGKNEEEQDDEEDDEDSEDSDAMDVELDEKLENLSDMDDIDDEDLSDMEFAGDDEDHEDSRSNKRKLYKPIKKISKKLKGLDDNTFVSAEEFAEMLEDHGQKKFKHGSSTTYSDRDGASAKQLDWETERNQKISGYRGGKKGKKMPKKFNGKKNFVKNCKKPVKRKKC